MQGGQSTVFKALRHEGEAVLALKEIRASPTQPKRSKRLQQELEVHRILSERHAPNIMPLVDYNIDLRPDGRLRGYLVMPYAPHSLDRNARIFTGRVELSLEVLIGIAPGVRVAHEAKIIHRDIKPANILFLDDTFRTPLLSDFGICFLKDTPAVGRVTDVDESVGARFFMAPEQERGGQVDVRESADIYALGKLLHYMLTNRTLFREELGEAFLPRECANDPRLEIIRERVLRRSIILDPAARVSSAEELIEILAALQAEFTRTRSPK